VLQGYRLGAVLAVGFGVRRHRGTQFRWWATEHLASGVRRAQRTFQLSNRLLDKARDIVYAKLNHYTHYLNMFR